MKPSTASTNNTNVKETRRSTGTTCTKPSTTSTNNNNVAKDINTSTRSADEPPPATTIGSKKRSSVESHFHKVGKICANSENKRRKKSKFQLGSDSDSSSNEDSDSDYLDRVIGHESDSLEIPKNDGR